jgi:hypothetical protein
VVALLVEEAHGGLNEPLARAAGGAGAVEVVGLVVGGAAFFGEFGHAVRCVLGGLE